MKTIMYSVKGFEESYLLLANHNRHELTLTNKPLNLETASMAAGNEAVAVFTNDDASEPVLQKLKGMGVNYITTRSVGTDHINLEAAKKLEISVANVPEYSPYSVAEHAVTLMLGLNRKLILADKKSHAYQFELSSLIGFDMHGKTVGIIGLGTIGSVVADILHGFGCRILVYDIVENKAHAKQHHFTYATLDEVYAQSDIITLHLPLTPQTKHLINEASIAKMKKGVMIINTSRGPIIDTHALMDGLRSGQIGSAGLDVYEFEKGIFFKNHYSSEGKDELLLNLMNFDNVIVTGHQAFLTQEALKNIADTTIENLNEWETPICEDCNATIGKRNTLEEINH